MTDKEKKPYDPKRYTIGYFRICSLCDGITEIHDEPMVIGGIHICDDCRKAMQKVKKAIKEGKL